MDASKMKIVYTVTERGEKSYWNRIGVAYVNRDGSLNVRLDAVPVDGTLQIRDWTPRDEASSGNPDRRSNGARGAQPSVDQLPEF